MPFKLFRNRDKRDKLPNSSGKSTIHLLPKTDNKSTKKTADENQLSTLLQKTFSQVLVNGIQRYLRRIKRKIDIFFLLRTARMSPHNSLCWKRLGAAGWLVPPLLRVLLESKHKSKSSY